MNRKPLTPEELKAECDNFNALCEIGGRVAVKIDGTEKPLITTTRTEAQILSGHSAVVWMDGVSGCYNLSHVTPIPAEGQAWAAYATNGNVIYWSRSLELVEKAAAKYEGSTVAPYTPPPRAAWSDKPPTEQGQYWHWNGDRESAPFALYVLYSGTAKKCFVPMNQTTTGHAIMCDEYGGFWLPLSPPKLPI